jgi:hypothetical protein
MDNEATETTVERKAPILYKFTNQKDGSVLDDLLAMFYMGVANNTLGIMEAFNLETGEKELILVGVELDADGKPDCYPLASCLSVEQTRNYLAPDGKDGWYDPRDPGETAAAKENFKSFEDSVVEPVTH